MERKKRDLNPWYISVRWLSKPVLSTTQPFLHVKLQIICSYSRAILLLCLQSKALPLLLPLPYRQGQRQGQGLALQHGKASMLCENSKCFYQLYLHYKVQFELWSRKLPC